MSETMTETAANPLAAAIWGEEPPATATVETTQSVEQSNPVQQQPEVKATEPEKKPEVQEEIYDANEYLKNNLGYDNWETAKSEIEQLRKLKEQQSAQEIKFANDDSERLFKALQEGKEDEIFEVISKKKEFERIEKLDISTVENAIDVIRLNLKLKYSDLTAGEIEDMLNEQYAKSEKPKQSIYETDEEYEAKVSEWKQRNEAVDKKLIRDAKIARPDVLKFKSDIVYPNIPAKSVEVKAEPSQEELQVWQKTKDDFRQSAESVIKSFNGFTATVKDKDVDYQVSYDLSNDEKQIIAKAINDFSENGLNTNAIFASRWLNDDNSINASQMVKDLSLILFNEKVQSKFVNDAASKRLEAYLKDKKQVDVNETTVTRGFKPEGEKEEMDKVRDYFFSV